MMLTFDVLFEYQQGVQKLFKTVAISFVKQIILNSFCDTVYICKIITRPNFEVWFYYIFKMIPKKRYDVNLIWL